jgi:type IV pilus assembly protein PilB
VFSTLHTNDSAGAVTRLIDMGVDPFLISSTLEAVLGQRLVRTICEECKTSYAPDPETLATLNLSEADVGSQPFYYGAGCSFCNDTGYHGRRGLYEYLSVLEPVRVLINERQPTLVIREKAIELGMTTMRQHGVQCLLDGYTTVDEIVKYT